MCFSLHRHTPPMHAPRGCRRRPFQGRPFLRSPPTERTRMKVAAADPPCFSSFRPRTCGPSTATGLPSAGVRDTKLPIEAGVCASRFPAPWITSPHMRFALLSWIVSQRSVTTRHWIVPRAAIPARGCEAALLLWALPPLRATFSTNPYFALVYIQPDSRGRRLILPRPAVPLARWRPQLATSPSRFPSDDDFFIFFSPSPCLRNQAASVTWRPFAVRKMGRPRGGSLAGPGWVILQTAQSIFF